MKNKHGMYINYASSYKKRRKGRKNTVAIILVIILAFGLGLGVLYVISTQKDRFHNNKKSSPNELLVEDDTKVNAEQEKAENEIDTQENELPTKPTVVQPITPSPGLPTPSVTKNTVEEENTRIPIKVKGIYVTSSVAGSNFIDELIELADTTEINAMVIDVKNDHGKITYSMNNAMAQEIGAVSNIISDMETLVTLLKEKGIYLIARIVAFKDPYLAEKRQDLAIKNKDGSLYRDNNGEGWVNPYNRKVWDYLVDVASQAAAIGFDEIQFDYIRFSTGGGISEADFGEDSEGKGKEKIIVAFTKYVYEKIKPLGVFVSADVYGTIISSSIDAGLVGQNFVEMSKYLDYICPMIYPSHFGDGNYGIQYPDLEPQNIIRKVLTASKIKLEQIPEGEHRAIVRPWLQDFTATWILHHMKYGGPELRAQIEGVYEAGYEEWLLWNAGCVYSADGLLEELE